MAFRNSAFHWDRQGVAVELIDFVAGVDHLLEKSVILPAESVEESAGVLFARGLCLPSGTAMNEGDLNRVVDVIVACRK